MLDMSRASLSTDHLIVAESSIDSEFIVIILYHQHELYDYWKQRLNDEYSSIAALIIGTKYIIVDGEALTGLTYDHLLAIEAHEIAHHRLNHTDVYEQSDEFEADKLGYEMLIDVGHHEAAMLIKQRLEHLYNYYIY